MQLYSEPVDHALDYHICLKERPLSISTPPRKENFKCAPPSNECSHSILAHGRKPYWKNKNNLHILHIYFYHVI